MITFFQLIEDGEFCSLSILIVLLLLAGGQMVNREPHLRLWGARIAGVAFVVYGLYSYSTFQPVYAFDFIGIVIRAGMASGLALGLSWIFLASVTFIFRQTLGNPISAIRRSISRTRNEIRSQREQVEAEARRERQDDFRREEEREKAEREKAELEAKIQDRLTKKRLAAEHQSKFSRTECELLYNANEIELDKLFPRKEFQKALKKNLSASQSAEQIEDYATLLKRSIFRYLKIGRSRPNSFKNIPEIAEHFREAREGIKEFDYDTDTRDALNAHLILAEEQAIQNFLSK